MGFESFCVICGGPVEYYMYDYADKSHKWLNDVYIITNNEKKLKINNGKTYYNGEYMYNRKRYNVYHWNWHQFSDNKRIKYGYGVVCHQKCYILLTRSLKYKLKFANICRKFDTNYGFLLRPTSKYGIIKKYVDQDFDYEKVHDDNNTWLLQNPLTNNKNKSRILKMWKPLVKVFRKNPPRPSPCESAKSFHVGKILQGYNRKLWIVSGTKKSRRWIPYKDNVNIGNVIIKKKKSRKISKKS